jgi:zinc/manganese transport system substrate-binding protein
MTFRFLYLFASLLFWVAVPAAADLKIFACEPEWGALARELGGDKVDVYVATNARQDPHRIEARPSLIARARSADLVVCSGAELEVGWLPLVLSQSGNARIQRGQPGYFEAARYVLMREVPASIDRAQGDVHAAGNPHIHLDPGNIAKVARALGERMQQLDAADAAAYAERAKAFLARWQQSVARWQEAAKPLAGMRVVVHHKDLSYLIAWLGM